jgi:parallel beta-helix repeat protein
VEENDEGIVLEFVCTDNLFTENTVRWNDITGFRLTPGASGNMIYHNDFQNNGQNAFDPSSNTWDNGYPDAGNFWYDYTGEDNNGDDVGDTPYPIPGGDNVDNYPLMYRYVYQCGDANYTWQVDIDDVVYTLAYIFSGGPPPYPGACVADTDGSGGTDIDDVVHLLAYIFGFGPAPAADCCETWW